MNKCGWKDFKTRNIKNQYANLYYQFQGASASKGELLLPLKRKRISIIKTQPRDCLNKPQQWQGKHLPVNIFYFLHVEQQWWHYLVHVLGLPYGRSKLIINGFSNHSLDAPDPSNSDPEQGKEELLELSNTAPPSRALAAVMKNCGIPVGSHKQQLEKLANH